MEDALEERVDALERAVTDGDADLSSLAETAAAVERVATVEERLDELQDRLAELEAATQALRGYVGNIRSVNRDVEKRADAALSKAESLEAAVPSAPDSPRAPDATTERRPGQTDTAAFGSSVPTESPATPDGGVAEDSGDGYRPESGEDSRTRREADRERRAPGSGHCRTCGQPRRPHGARDATTADPTRNEPSDGGSRGPIDRLRDAL